ncbi:heme-binding protein [Nocardia sp. NPDC052566]|uniref:heme-binding protein n=1 Tax=Nocardia sp. NPDC052566 TaxID=3364330 RepID=UPI0037CA725C
MTSITLDHAARMIAAGTAAATEIGVAMNIAIVDAGGYLVHFSRMDDAFLGSIDLALRKAKTAVLFRMPTDALGAIAGPDGPAYGIESSNGGLISFGGGLPVVDTDGRTVGAVGVSGGMVDQDVLVAEACVGALAPATRIVG